MRKLDAVVNRIIRSRRESGGDRGDLLSKLIHARDEVDHTGMTDRQLRDEVMTMFFAGHETTANALGWTWFLLGQNRDAEQRLLDELNDVLGDRWPDVADIPKLTYTEAVIKESLRLYPPAYAFSRRVVADATIGGYHIPAGSAVLMSQWVIHRDAALVRRTRSVPPGTLAQCAAERTTGLRLLPFRRRPARLHWQHLCHAGIGMLVLAAVAPRFRFELIAPENVKPWPSVTLRSAGGIPAVIRQRSAGFDTPIEQQNSQRSLA